MLLVKTGIGLLFSTVFIISSSVAASEELSIVPLPVETTQITGQRFKLSSTTKIHYTDTAAKDTADLLAEFLRSATGLRLPVSEGSSRPNTICLQITNEGMGKEGYALSVTSQSVVVSASETTGLIFGIQTIRQLLPPQIYSPKKVAGIDWSIPAVRIKDKPRYQWRGLHLDVCRHFMSKAFIKKYIDLLSIHRMNVFHWHLTEDQAWRIEIKKYPRLTEVGAWRPGIGFGLDPKATTHYDEKGRYGGYYSQDDVGEIVAYAARRGVTIVPEIELPGHSMAALAAYPQFACTKGPFTVQMRGGVFHDVYCPGKDETLKFLGDVLNEVADLFPGAYFHIGGDECRKTRWKECVDCQKRIKDNNLKDEHELQSWIIKWAEKTLAKKGKSLIGWDEILEGGLAPNAAVMSWRGTHGGIKAAHMGHNVVMSPTSHCYFDYRQAARGEPRAIRGGPTSLEKAYSFEPTPNGLPADKQKYILGAQANLWTEFMPNEKHVEYMAYPRACALAEVTWSPKSQRNWDDFARRMRLHHVRLRELDVNARIPPIAVTITEGPPGTATIVANKPEATIHFTLDGSEPTTSSSKYTAPVTVKERTGVRAIAVLPGGRKSLDQLKALLMPKVTVTTTLPIHQDHNAAHILDGDPGNIFWSNRPPRPGDHITATFDTAVESRRITVITGKIGGGDKLANGVLEVSVDGTTYKTVATFSNGTATAELSGRIKGIRILPTRPHKNWLVVRELLLEKD